MSSSQASTPVHSGSSEGDDWLTVPNALTMLRLAAIVPFVLLVTQGRDRAGLILFVLAGLTDTLDGTLARALNQKSKIGRLLDPLADKLFTGVAYVALSFFRHHLPAIPQWVMIAVLLRDLLILAGSLVVYRASRNSGFQPSFFGKLNTLLEISIVAVFLAQPEVPLFTVLLPIAYILLLILLSISAGDYLIYGLRMMRTKPAIPGK